MSDTREKNMTMTVDVMADKIAACNTAIDFACRELREILAMKPRASIRFRIKDALARLECLRADG